MMRNIYKVCIPSLFAFPFWKAALAVFSTREDAVKYMEEYPLVYMQPWLFIDVQPLYFVPDRI